MSDEIKEEGRRTPGQPMKFKTAIETIDILVQRVVARRTDEIYCDTQCSDIAEAWAKVAQFFSDRRIAELQTDLEILKSEFDLRQNADKLAIDLWRQKNPKAQMSVNHAVLVAS